MAVSLTTPDGYQVNERGRWCEENVEQTFSRVTTLQSAILLPGSQWRAP